MAKSLRERPAMMTEEHLTYLDELRESGDTNMYGAAAWLEDEFAMPRRQAKDILRYWMGTFTERHPKG